MAVPGASATPPAPATDYASRYKNQPDAFNGQYATLYTPYDATNGLQPEDLFETVVSSDQNVPKVFLAQVEIDNEYKVIALHRPSRYEQDLTKPSQLWADKVFAFLGDICSGSNFIRTVTFPEEAFKVTKTQRVTVHANVSAKWNQDPNVGILEAVPSNEAGSTTVATRFLIPVPWAYVPLVFGKIMSTREAWTTITTALVQDSRQDACLPLIDWLRVDSFRRQKGTAPATNLGAVDIAFPTVSADEQLDRHRWNVLTRDLPALGGNTTSTGGGFSQQQFVQLLSTMRTDRATERAQDEARRQAEKQDKLPSATKYKMVAREWMAFSSVTNEADLPPVYLQLVNSDKGEHLTVLRNAMKERARQSDAATDHTPIISKETKEMVMTARYGVEPHQAHDLTLGLQPFSVGLFMGDELSKAVDLRATGYETMLQGLAAPTLGEQATFSTKEIRIPQDPFVAGMMLFSTSIQLDVLQGKNHPCATAFRYFCDKQWSSIATTLQLSSRYNPALGKAIIPRILRWIQTHLVSYFHRLIAADGAPTTPLPPFADLHSLITLQQFNLLPELPDAYRLAIAPDTSAASDRKPSPTAADAKDATTPHRDSNDKTDKSARASNNRGGAMVTNPTISSVLKQKLEASTKRIRDIHTHAPASTDTDAQGNHIPICLSYHLRRHCYANCNRVKTHRPLSTAESAALSTMAQQQLE